MIDEEYRLELVNRFETEMREIQRRPGIEKLMDYIRQSDFYTAPASTRFHLSCRGGLLQHSLNVLDALRSIVLYNPAEKRREYIVAGKVLDTISDESITIIALLHDICKTRFYNVSTRNQKNKLTGKWEEVPFYTIDDKMPLGHGSKSVMMIRQYMDLTFQEVYAIWWHMGFTGGQDDLTFRNAVEQYPIVWATHTADMMATAFMEDKDGNRELFESFQRRCQN